MSEERVPSGERGAAFVLFACCVPVRGARRSLLCDLQRGALHFIPNDLCEILVDHRHRTLSEIKEIYDHECDAEIEEYFSFLVDAELGFWCDHPDNFPSLSSGWDPPEKITNAILDVDAGSRHDYREIFRQLDDLGCKALEVRFFNSCRLAEVKELLDQTRRGRLRSIELLVGYSEEISQDAIAALCAANPRISNLLIHSSPSECHVELDGAGPAVQFCTARIDSPSCCGQVRPSYFVVNLESWSESRRWNSCLNRKISIDASGEIRNCPSLPNSFGNLQDTSLHSALARREFTALWAINKDQIEVCKDCEFRYVCIDCRAYISTPDNIYSKPAKCKYNPYTAEWTDY